MFGASPENRDSGIIELFNAQELARHFSGRSGEEFGAFLAGFAAETGASPAILLDVNSWFEERNKNILTSAQHFSWLLSRCYQYLFVKHFPKGLSCLASLGAAEWQAAIRTIHTEHSQELRKLCRDRFVATFLPNRYAAFGALLSTLHHSYGTKPAHIVDLGCSVNLGVATIFNPQFVPDVEQSAAIWQAPIDHLMPDTIVGVDIQPQDREWIIACYWPKYVESMQSHFEEIDRLIFENNINVRFVQADAAVPDFVLQHYLSGQSQVVHASLMQYFLSEERRQGVRLSATALLEEGGFFIETDMFGRGDDLARPLAVETRVSRKTHGRLGSPLTIIRFAGDAQLSADGRPSDSCAYWQVDEHNLALLRGGHFS